MLERPPMLLLRPVKSSVFDVLNIDIGQVADGYDPLAPQQLNLAASIPATKAIRPCGR
jgi:hypothetical protein